MKRRTLLGAAGWALLPQIRAQARASVVILGGGWAGLSTARALREAAPELDVTVVDRSPTWRSLPLSTPWLVGWQPERLPRLDLAALGRTQGWRFVAADISSVDRERRQVHTLSGPLHYDWLVVATGAEGDHSAWFGDDTLAAERTRTRFPAGFEARELDRTREALMSFTGTDLVMTIPPPPYRCPPAPYERAMLIAWWLRRRGRPARLTVLDAGAGMPRYTRLFAERCKDWIDHRPHSLIRQVDPDARRITTDEGTLSFGHALLLPPMRAARLVEQAGLSGTDARGQPSRWAAVRPATLQSVHDDRVWVVGDVLDQVSPLFGPYPKTAQIAARLGAAAAGQIAAASRGEPPPPPQWPDSECHVWLDAEPAEQMRLDTRYQLRGDGLLTQTVRQHAQPQPQGEDLQWALALLDRHITRRLD